jgi:hypothetical protein
MPRRIAGTPLLGQLAERCRDHPGSIGQGNACRCLVSLGIEINDSKLSGVVVRNRIYGIAVDEGLTLHPFLAA